MNSHLLINELFAFLQDYNEFLFFWCTNQELIVFFFGSKYNWINCCLFKLTYIYFIIFWLNTTTIIILSVFNKKQYPAEKVPWIETLPIVINISSDHECKIEKSTRDTEHKITVRDNDDFWKQSKNKQITVIHAHPICWAGTREEFNDVITHFFWTKLN